MFCHILLQQFYRGTKKTMQMGLKIYRIFLMLIVLMISIESIAGQELKVLTQKTPLIFDGDKAIEPSAVEKIGNGKFLLVADDKDNKGKSLKVVDATTGKVLQTLDKIQPAEKNPKWEAMAKDKQGNYYVIGSHYEESDPEKLALRSLMFSFRLKNENEQDGTKIAIDTATIKPLNIKNSLTAIGLYSNIPANTTAKIEGLAVKTNECQTELIIGFREPSKLVQIYSATIPNSELNNNSLFELSIRPYFQFVAGKTSDNTPYKLSSIEYVQDLHGFLISTSTETADSAGKPIFHGNALWFVSDKEIENSEPKLLSESFKTTKVQKVLEFEPTMKVEGLCLFSNEDKKKFQLTLVYDNDTKESSLAGKLQFIDLAVKN